MRMAGGGVVHRHVQGEIIRVDANFIELVRGNEQVQRQLFVTEVVADRLRQEAFARVTER